MSVTFTWRLKLAFVAFGVLFGGGAAWVALAILNRPQAGTSFESLDDLRRAMLAPTDSTQSGSEGTPLRGIITAHPDDKIIYDLRPNLRDVPFQRAKVDTNSCGMRGPERTIAKPSDVYRIALLGDSFTFGWGVEQPQAFAQVLEDNLNRASGGSPRFEVLNFGVPGYSTFQEVAKFKESGLDFNPDAVLIFFIENDFGLPFFVRDIYNPGGMLSSASFTQMLFQKRDPKIEEQQVALQGLDPNRALRELSDITRERGIKLFFTMNPKKETESMLRKLWIVKQRPDINVIRLRPAFMKAVEREQIDKKDLTLSFDPHPSPIKHRLLGELLAPYFMAAIR